MDEEDSRSNLDDVTDLEVVLVTRMALSAETQPGSVGAANVLKEVLLVVLTFLALVSDLSVEITHLSVFRNEVVISWISSNPEALIINDHSLSSLRTFKHLQLNIRTSVELTYSELTQPHLEHHVFLERYLLSDHQEGPSG